jgi:hypothetical protein
VNNRQDRWNIPECCDMSTRRSGVGQRPRVLAESRGSLPPQNSAGLRKLCGPIVIESDADGSVWARFDLHPRRS